VVRCTELARPVCLRSKLGMHRHALSDEQWARIRQILPPQKTGPRATFGDRSFIDAVIFRAKTGIPWRDLPERFGPWKSVYNRFCNGSRKGHFQGAAIRDGRRGMYCRWLHSPRSPRRCGRKRGVRRNALGRSRGGFSTKIHALVDTKGRPIHIALTAGQAHELSAAPELLAHAREKALPAMTRMTFAPLSASEACSRSSTPSLSVCVHYPSGATSMPNATSSSCSSMDSNVSALSPPAMTKPAKASLASYASAPLPSAGGELGTAPSAVFVQVFALFSSITCWRGCLTRA